MAQVTTMYGNEGRVLMTDSKLKTPDPFASVELVPLEVAGREVPQMAVMMDDGEGERHFVASHSTGYRLVANELVSQIVEDVIDHCGFQASHINTAWNGKRFLERFQVQEISLRTDGDSLTLGIDAINSYDGSAQFGVRFFMWRKVCENGLYAWDQLGGFLFHHLTGGNNIDLEDAVQRMRTGSERFMSLAPAIERLENASLHLEDVLSWVGKLMEGTPAWPTSKTGHVLKALNEGPHGTLWNLTNAFTNVTSHEVGPFRGAALSNKVSQLAFSSVGLGE